MKETESTILRRIQVAASQLGARLFRNNVGTAWVGEVTRPVSTRTFTVGPGDIIIRHARPLHAGLCEGSSDLIGWSVVRISPDMVGQTVAIFSACEIKASNTKTTEEQASFIKAVQCAGGLGMIARSEEDFVRELDDYRGGRKWQ